MEPMTTGKAEVEWAAFAAIDWANQKHYWRLVAAGSKQQEQGELENTPEAVEVWAASLQERFGGKPIAICLEQSRGGLVWMLAKYAHLVLFPVNPTMAARYRETFCTSGAKSDPTDTGFLLDLLMRHRERLRGLQPDTVETRLLQFLVEERRQMVNEATRQKNRLTDDLKQYFPQILRWFDDVNTPLVGDLLETWPTLEQLRRAHPGTLNKFLQKHNCRSAERNQGRIESIYAAVPATQDAAVLEAGALTAQGLVALLRTLREHIAVLEQRIAQLVLAHPDGELFASLPGAGPVLVSRLIAAWGTQRDRYQSAYAMQCYSGIAPVTSASGGTSWVHFRWASPKFLRQTFHEYALHSLEKSEWARAYYEYQRKENKATHHAAVRSLAYKWIRIIFRCWKDGKRYDEEVYMNSLRRRGAEWAALLAPATELAWQPVAGFQKLSKKKLDGIAQKTPGLRFGPAPASDQSFREPIVEQFRRPRHRPRDRMGR